MSIGCNLGRSWYEGHPGTLVYGWYLKLILGQSQEITTGFIVIQNKLRK